MKNLLNERFAKNLKVLRKSAGFTQDDFGDLIDVHRTYISGLEAGRRNASLKTVEKIVAPFDFDSRFMLDDELPEEIINQIAIRGKELHTLREREREREREKTSSL